MSRTHGLTIRSAGIFALTAVSGLLCAAGSAQAPAGPFTRDPAIASLVSRLDLERYKTTIKGLTAFGDRREGTQRNRDAIDWIESQLKSSGCTSTGRFAYEPPAPTGRAGRRASAAPGRAPAGTPEDPVRRGPGGKGFGAPTGVNNDPLRQPDEALRALDMQPVLPGPREVLYCTKVGSSAPNEMYILSAHMDGIGYGEAANDDGSGTAIVMELARILNAPDVTTARSVRFIFWNGEEQGLLGARAYVASRRALQGREDPAGSGKYPEPKWLGIIQHDMMLWDHGMPGPDGSIAPAQRAEADLNIEFNASSDRAADAQALAWLAKDANVRYATDYPATVGRYMQNTDSEAFMNAAPAISVRENERRDQIGFGWDPNWHQPTDVFTTYSDQDFRLGLNAAQTTLATVAQLAGVHVAAR